MLARFAAHHPFSVAELSGYAASKAGIGAITRSTALEVASSGITVNCVALGPMRTAMQETVPHAVTASILARIPMRRIGTPEEVAALVGFLASGTCGLVTGQVIYIDGGLSLGVLSGAIEEAGGVLLEAAHRNGVHGC